MPRFYMRPVGDATQFSDAADYPQQPADRPGFEWMTGEPPVGAVSYREKTRQQKLEEYFLGKVLEHQAQLTDAQLGDVMTSSANVTESFKLDGSIPEAILKRLVLGSIQRANSFPAELQAVKDDILAFADSLFSAEEEGG